MNETCIGTREKLIMKCGVPNNGMVTHQYPMTCELVSDSCAKVNEHKSLPVYELSIR